VRITWFHDLSCEFVMLNQIGSGLLHHFILFSFYVKFGPHSFNCFFSLNPFLKLILFFQFHPSTLKWLRIGLYKFF